MAREHLETLNSSLFKVGDDILHHICEYLLSTDLCQLSMTTNSVDWGFFLESTWERLVKKKWRVTNYIRKKVGAPTWKLTYRALQLRQLVPEGKYSGRLHHVFLKGRLSNVVESWVMVAHGSSAVLRETLYNDSSWNIVEARICVQNSHKERIQLRLNSTLVDIRAFSSDELEDNRLPTANWMVVSRNGEFFTTTQETLVLNPLDFAVISFSVLCPRSVPTEPDFLTMIESFSLQFQRFETTGSPHHFQETLPLSILSEDKVWEAYEMLPNGLVLLKSSSTMSNL